MTSVLCDKQESEKKSSVGDKKHEKRGIWDEGYGGGDFGGGGGGGGGWGHDFEEDHHHTHHHVEKTIVNVKKVTRYSIVI